jgi:hypothetical protein
MVCPLWWRGIGNRIKPRLVRFQRDQEDDVLEGIIVMQRRKSRGSIEKNTQKLLI